LFSVETENEYDTHRYMQCDMPLFAIDEKRRFFRNGMPVGARWVANRVAFGVPLACV
jgi:hypothetical protein